LRLDERSAGPARHGSLGWWPEWTHRVLEPATIKYWIRKPQMTAVDLQKGEKIGQVAPHAIDKQAEELVFEAACGLDSAIDSPHQRGRRSSA